LRLSSAGRQFMVRIRSGCHRKSNRSLLPAFTVPRGLTNTRYADKVVSIIRIAAASVARDLQVDAPMTMKSLSTLFA